MAIHQLLSHKLGHRDRLYQANRQEKKRESKKKSSVEQS